MRLVKVDTKRNIADLNSKLLDQVTFERTLLELVLTNAG